MLPSTDKSWRSTLLARPVRNTAADVHREDNGLLRVTVEARKPKFLVPPLSWIIRPRLTRSFVLDATGTELWDLCDGDRTVEQVVEKFAESHGLSFHEARASATVYMKDLVRRGAIAIVM